MVSWATVRRELSIHFRSTWTYAFVIFFAAFTTAILYLSGDAVGIGQYSKATGTIMNLIAYFLPLMTLVMGAFSLTMEKEDGSWQLLLTYPISTVEWIVGKFFGMLIVLVTIVTGAFSLAGLVISLFDHSLSFETVVLLYLYALCLVVLFLTLSVLIGVLSMSRWQALTISIGVWVLFVLAWPVLLMSTLHSLPFQTSLKALQIATLLNPMEFTRLFFTIKMGGGNVFGPQYVDWVSWIQQPLSSLYFIGLALLWMLASIAIAVIGTERSRYRGT